MQPRASMSMHPAWRAVGCGCCRLWWLSVVEHRALAPASALGVPVPPGCHAAPRLHYALAFERTLIHCSAPATLLRAPACAIGRQDNYYAKHFQVPAHHSVKIPARWGRFPDAFQVLLAQCRVQCRFPGA